MKIYSIVAFMVFATIFLCFVPFASCMDTPDITIIPSKITANSSFLVIADPHPDADEIIRVEWMVPTISSYVFGLLPKDGDNWACYFSNTDDTSTCGPSPFEMTTKELGIGVDWRMHFNATNQDLEHTGEIETVEIGGIELIPNEIIVNTNNRSAYVKIYPQFISGGGVPVSGVSYSVYNENFAEVATGNLEYNAIGGFYFEDITFSGGGDYFIAFEAEKTDGGDFGGGVVKVSMGGALPGEDDVIEAQSVSRNVVLNSAQDSYTESGYTLTNIGSANLTNLTLYVDGSLDDYLAVEVEDSDIVLEPGKSTTFSFTVESPSGQGLGINTFARIYANVSENGIITIENISVGSILFNISLSFIGSGVQDPCEGKSDGALCPGGKCVHETCILGGFDCLSDDDCGSGEECIGLVCMSAGGCPSGSTCYAGTSSSDCPDKTKYSGKTCEYENGSGVCCEAVECTVNSDCTTPEPFCVKNNCVECRDDDDCDAGYVCNVNKQCEEIQATACPSGSTCRSSCLATEDATGYKCDLSEAGTLDGVCCEPGGTIGGEGDITPIIFVVVIIAIISVGVWYYFKKYKGRGRRGRSKEEEDLEKELEEEF